jgi:hypothetical protein
MKTALQRCIWPLRIAAATGPRVIILRARKAASGVESVKAIWRGSWEQGGWDECSSPVAG